MNRVLEPFIWLFRVIISAAEKFYWDDCFSRASSLAYTTLFALVPISALTFALFKGFAIQEGEAYIERIIGQILPSEITLDLGDPPSHLAAETSPEENADGQESTASGEFQAVDPLSPVAEQEELLTNLKKEVFDTLRELGENVRDAGIVTLGILLFIGIALLNTIESALNGVWRVSSSQGVVPKVISFWAVISLGPLLIALSFYWYSKFGQLGEEDPLFHSRFFPIIDILVPLAAIWLALTLLYYKLPGAPVQLKDAALGAIFGALGFELMKRAFGYYISVSTTYSTFYGVLVTIPLFLFWLYLVWVIVLFGAEICYQAGSIKILSGLRKYSTDLGEIGALLGLRILYVVGQRFIEGRPPATEGDITLETESDPVLVRTCLNVLADANLITSAEPDTRTRALMRSPEKIRVSDVVRAFQSKHYRKKIAAGQAKEELPDESSLLEPIRRTSLSLGPERNSSDWTLAELLREQVNGNINA